MPRQLPLTRIYFLSRDASLKRMNLSALGKMKFIQLLLQNGFSELPLANVWKMQFVQYSRIVDLAAAFQLTLPDGTDHLEETLMTLVGQPFPVGEAMHFPLSSAQAERYMS
jgi:hypothetical protein